MSHFFFVFPIKALLSKLLRQETTTTCLLPADMHDSLSYYDPVAAPTTNQLKQIVERIVVTIRKEINRKEKNSFYYQIGTHQLLSFVVQTHVLNNNYANDRKNRYTCQEDVFTHTGILKLPASAWNIHAYY